MKKIFLVLSLVFLSLTNTQAATYECFEVTLHPVILFEGARVSDGATLELKFKANKVKLNYIESGDSTKFIGQIIKKDELDEGPDFMGSIDSEMYTLVIKESPPFYLESVARTGHILATFYTHGGSGIPMFCDFIKEKYRFY